MKEKIIARQEKALVNAFNGKNITLEMRDAMGILDKLSYLTEQERKTLFFYHLWDLSDGSFAAIKEFGEIREDIPFMLDRVMDSDYLASAYDKFLSAFNNRGKRGVEFLELLNEGLSPKDAVSEMGIAYSEPSEDLSNHDRFTEFCENVYLLENVMISDAEIASAYGVSEGRVKRARRRLRAEGRADTRTPKDVASANSRRFAQLKLMLKGQDGEKTIGEVVKKTGATRQQVLHQRAVLLNNGEMIRRTRDDTKKKLIKILNKHVKQNLEGTPINLSKVYRDAGLEVSWSTIQSLYHEIAQDQIVPPLSYNHKRS